MMSGKKGQVEGQANLYNYLRNLEKNMDIEGENR